MITRLEDVLKMSWRHFCKKFWRRLEDVFRRRKAKANIFFLIKTSSRRLLKAKAIDVFKTSSLRRMFAGMFLQISQNSQENTKKIFRYRCFLVNSAKFLITPFLKNPSDGCFCINTRSVYFPTTTFRLFKNDVAHFFSLSIFSVLFVGWEQKWTQYVKPWARNLFST